MPAIDWFSIIIDDWNTTIMNIRGFIRAPQYGGCPVVISLCVRVWVRPSVTNEVFQGFFYIGTWNFPWFSSELSYISSSCFIIMTPMVPELCALRFLYPPRRSCGGVYWNRVVRLSVRPSDVFLLDFYIFNFFFRTAGPILTKVGTNHP
jgi:hypothetical protein